MPGSLPSPPHRPRAFSLTELLIVIAIVAVLAAFLFPVFRRLTTSTAIVKCTKRVHQTGMGILLYAADHHGTLPGPYPAATFFPYYRKTPNPQPVGDGGLYSYIWRYCGLPEPEGTLPVLARLGVCPLAERGNTTEWLMRSKFFKTGVHWQNATSYAPYPEWNQLPSDNQQSRAYPFGLTESGRLNPPALPWKIASVRLPAQMALLGEMTGNPDNATSFHSTADLPHDLNAHCNLLFLDGHVETRPRHSPP
ncbi:MAG TPA: prepilin-type N-terminal cleavage/methylation domain-containing protein [Chthoniobacteraceae bacterium]|nr:prepilin-type N-terminal cleavage/methylation domain-containing protein [Chthoniobacteraceae bacterium]